METWEMIKELTENPEKKFISGKGISPNEMIAEILQHNILFRYTNNGVRVDCVSVTREWEEVKEPVSFMEVLEQVSKSKTEVLITIKHSQLNTIYSKVPFGWIVNRLFRDFKNDKQIAKILQTSEFYIE